MAIFREEAQNSQGSRASTSAPFNVFRLPTRVVGLFSLTATALLVIWAFTAKIPMKHSGRAAVFDIDETIALEAPTTGRLIYITSQQRNQFQILFSKLWKIVNDAKYNPTGQEALDIANQLLFLTDNDQYTLTSTDGISTQESLEQIDQGSLNYQIGDVVAIVYSNDIRSSLAETLRQQIYTYNTSLTEIELAQKQIDSYQKLSKSQEAVVDIYADLIKDEFVSKIELIQEQSQVAEFLRFKAQSESDFINSKEKYIRAKKQLGQAIANFAGSAFVFSEHDGQLIHTAIRQNAHVDEGDMIFWMTKNPLDLNQLPTTLIGTISTKASNFVHKGNRAVLTPLGFNKSEYGGIVGDISYVEAFPSSESTLGNVIGLKSIESSLFDRNSGSTSSLVLFNMEFSDKDKTSYKWTSKTKAPNPVKRGDILNAAIVTDSQTPAQLVIPWLKVAFGLSGPTSLQNSN